MFGVRNNDMCDCEKTDNMVLDKEGQIEHHIDHERSGDLVVVAEIQRAGSSNISGTTMPWRRSMRGWLIFIKNRDMILLSYLWLPKQTRFALCNGCDTPWCNPCQRLAWNYHCRASISCGVFKQSWKGWSGAGVYRHLWTDMALSVGVNSRYYSWGLKSCRI